MHNKGSIKYIWNLFRIHQKIMFLFSREILIFFTLPFLIDLSGLNSAYGDSDDQIYKLSSVAKFDLTASNINSIKTPEQPIDIIRNIRDVYALGFPIQDSFYNNELLKRIFLLKNFSTNLVEHGKFDIISGASGTPDILKIAPTTPWFPAIYITAGIKYKWTWHVHSVLHLGLESWRPSLDEVKELFGSDWRKTKTTYYDGSPPPPNVKHGDETLLFEFKGPSFKWSATVELDENAHLKNLNMYEEAN